MRTLGDPAFVFVYQYLAQNTLFEWKCKGTRGWASVASGRGMRRSVAGGALRIVRADDVFFPLRSRKRERLERGQVEAVERNADGGEEGQQGRLKLRRRCLCDPRGTYISRGKREAFACVGISVWLRVRVPPSSSVPPCGGTKKTGVFPAVTVQYLRIDVCQRARARKWMFLATYLTSSGALLDALNVQHCGFHYIAQ